MKKGDMQDIIDYITEAKDGVQTIVNNEECLNLIKLSSEKIIERVEKGSKIFACGNGGSMTDAMHFAEELTGRFRKNRKPISAISISDPAHITCVANDFGFENIFSRFLEANSNPGDILLAISTSGNSPNIIKACEFAKKNNLIIISLTGKEKSRLNEFADFNIKTPCGKYSDHIQELHGIVLHCIVRFIEIKFFPHQYIHQGD